MSDTDNNLGTDGTIPNSPDGIAVGHDPDGSNFNPEEDDTTTAADTTPKGPNGSLERDDDSGE